MECAQHFFGVFDGRNWSPFWEMDKVVDSFWDEKKSSNNDIIIILLYVYFFFSVQKYRSCCFESKFFSVCSCSSDTFIFGHFEDWNSHFRNMLQIISKWRHARNVTATLMSWTLNAEHEHQTLTIERVIRSSKSRGPWIISIISFQSTQNHLGVESFNVYLPSDEYLQIENILMFSVQLQFRKIFVFILNNFKSFIFTSDNQINREMIVVVVIFCNFRPHFECFDFIYF